MTGKTITAAFLASLLGLATAARAQEPGAEGKPYDLKKAIREVSRMLRETESLLVKATAAEHAKAAGKSGERSAEELGKLLRESREKGSSIVEKITEIIENAPTSRGSGQGQESEKKKSGKDNGKKKTGGKLTDRDPGNSAKEPASGRRDKRKVTGKTKPPPASAKDAPRNPKKDDWLATLPDKVRQALLNGEDDRIPARWRKLIEEYLKKIADLEGR